MKIIYCDMVGDLFHHGHVNFLKKCKQFGDYLLVGVHKDTDVESYKRIPILSLEERMKVIKACKYVDDVTVGPLIVTREFLEKYKIDCVVHAHDEKDKSYDYQYKNVPKNKFIRLDYTTGISTTDIINRICERFKKIS
jgi:cytidyltransferase-like protein